MILLSVIIICIFLFGSTRVFPTVTCLATEHYSDPFCSDTDLKWKAIPVLGKGELLAAIPRRLTSENNSHILCSV